MLPVKKDYKIQKPPLSSKSERFYFMITQLISPLGYTICKMVYLFLIQLIKYLPHNNLTYSLHRLSVVINMQ